MKRSGIAIVGASESTELGVLPHISQTQLHADAALNALADAGLAPSDIDGFATAGEVPTPLCHYLGIEPLWIDGTDVGGCSYIAHIRHAAAAIEAGLCTTVLITHAESGRSGVGRKLTQPFLSNLHEQFEQPFGTIGPASNFTLPILRYMKRYGLTHDELATVAVIQREWAAMNPRATHRDSITVEDVRNSRLIAYPIHLLECCVVTDGGGAIIVTAADRARDFPRTPVYVLGTGEATESALISQMADYTSSRAYCRSGEAAFQAAGITPTDVDHLMAYDAFAHLPIYTLGDLGFVERGEVGQFIADRHTAPGGSLPTNTNGGGLSYMHSGRYGMYALQEAVRQLRGVAPAQVPDVEISVVHGVGGMFAAAATAILTNVPP